MIQNQNEEKYEEQEILKEEEKNEEMNNINEAFDPNK